MNRLSDEQLNKISNLVREIEKLSDIEKLLLYLKLPCGRVDQQDVKGGRNNGKTGADIFAKKPDQETTQTYTWILSHLEEDPTVSLPKQEVYDEYKAFCQINRLEPLCVADFGKAMKHVFPCIKPRRLGQRGNSRYCYSGLRKRLKIQTPSLPDLSIRGLVNSDTSSSSGSSNASASNINTATINSNNNYGCCQQTIDSCNSQQQSYMDQIGSGGGNVNEQYRQQSIEQQQNSQLCHQQQSVGPATGAAQQHLFATYEVMNLKIEPNDGQPANQAHPYRNQPPPPPPPQPDDACVNTNNCQCNNTLTNKIILNGPLPMSINNNNNSNSDNSFLSTAMHHLESPGGDSFTMGHNPSDSSNQQPHRALNSGNNHHPCVLSQCDNSVMQLRSGTPDDDDYVHNYQNLTSVDNDRHLISVSMHPLAQIHPQQQQQQQQPQQQQPSDNCTTQQQTATNQVMTNCCTSTGAPAADIYNQQHQQQPQVTSPTASIPTDIANNPPTVPSSTHQPQTMINAAAKTMTTTTTTLAAPATSANPISAQNDNNSNDQLPGRHHQQQLRHPSSHRLVHSTLPQHLHHHYPYLSTGSLSQYQGFPASLQLHLTELGNPNLDYSSASPFQSPSTTPNLITMSTGSSSSSSTSGGGPASGHSPQNIHLGGYYSTSSCLRYIN